MYRRLRLIWYTMRRRRTGGPWMAWLLNCLGPTCDVLARPHIEEICELSGYRRLKLRNAIGYLYSSTSIPIRSLYQTLAEQLYPWQWHYYQIAQTSVVPGDIVFDCGCAEGVFSFLSYGKARHIYAFEPLPVYVEGLQRTFAHATNVSIVNRALGAERGTAYLSPAGISTQISTEVTDTPVGIDTIDNFCAVNDIGPSFIKADVEGYEIHLLQGAQRTIRRHKPKIAITTYHVESHAERISRLLLNIDPSYQILLKGIEERRGAPVMLHAW